MGGRIVVLDDEANMGKVLTKLLTLEGFDVESFTEPARALDHIERYNIDILISDLRMPSMTGEEVLEKTIQMEFAGKVILMTAYGTVESAMRCVHRGAFDYITKPFLLAFR